MAGEKERGKISLKSIISINPMPDNLSFEFETFDKLRVLRAQSKRGTAFFHFLYCWSFIFLVHPLVLLCS
jgi:hypothetical protein